MCKSEIERKQHNVESVSEQSQNAFFRHLRTIRLDEGESDVRVECMDEEEDETLMKMKIKYL